MTPWLCTLASAFAALSLGGANASAQQPGIGEPPDAIISEQEAGEALEEAEELLAGESAEPTRELTLVLRELALGIRKLDGKERRRARAILARPTDGPSDPQGDGYTVAEAPPHCTAHFCVHYVTSTADAPQLTDVPGNGIPDSVESVGVAAEASFATENGTLGWNTPISDGPAGGNSKTDIYMADIYDKAFGYATPDPGQGGARRQAAYLVIHKLFTFRGYVPVLGPLQSLIAHEYNHVLQFAYDSFQDDWLFESTATYMEDVVFPASNAYIRLDMSVSEFAQAPQLPLTERSSPEANEIYGAAVWHHYLASRFGHSVSPDTWASSTKSNPKDFAIGATNVALQSRGSSFSKEFARFTPTTAEWKANGIYADGPLYPDVKRSGTLNPGQKRNTRLDHTAYRLYDVPVGSARGAAKDDLKLTVAAKTKKKKTTRSGVALVARSGAETTGAVVSKLKFLKKGKGSVKLKNYRGYDRVTAVVTNADGRVFAGLFDNIYKRDNVKYRVKLKAS